jgi:hypothetical protein
MCDIVHRCRSIIMSRPIMALIVSIALSLCVGSAHASACSDEIAQLEKAISEKSAAAAPTARQTIGAQLGHQPTPESVQRAEGAATTGVDDILNRAKILDAEGKTKECMDLVATAKLRLE